ncbi:hypothetical protein XmelCFBP4644_18395 [Xanthomonas melonis]|uniref:Uncharacterized protein n=1 Tax=Xanthomonas melonis TaxID=56456 RepID=A0A2S7DB05_9XANT|nr:hypothetical protein XmelCFBP4644_18395 [Xanthomonas melonis]
MGRACGVLTARGTRRKYVPVGSVAASMPPHGPAIGDDTAPESLSVAVSKLVHRSACIEKMMGCAFIVCVLRTDHLRWSLPAHRRGTLRGMDAA